MGTFTACFDLGVGHRRADRRLRPRRSAATASRSPRPRSPPSARACSPRSLGRRRAALPVARCRSAPCPLPRRRRASPRRGDRRPPIRTASATPAAGARSARPSRSDSGSRRSPPAAPAPSRRHRSPKTAALAIDRLQRLRPPRRDLVLRLNRMFWAEGTAGIHRYARIVDRFAAAGFATELQVRYHPPAGKAGDMRRLEALRARCRPDPRPAPVSVVALSITNEANFDVSPNTSDGSYPGVRRAIVARRSSPPSTSSGRSAAATSSSASRSPGAGCPTPIARSGSSSDGGRRRASGARSTTSGCRSTPASSSRRRSRPARAPGARPSRR